MDKCYLCNQHGTFVIKDWFNNKPFCYCAAHAKHTMTLQYEDKRHFWATYNNTYAQKFLSPETLKLWRQIDQEMNM